MHSRSQRSSENTYYLVKCKQQKWKNMRWGKFHQMASGHECKRHQCVPKVFCVSITFKCNKFKQILQHIVGFKCPHHLMVSPPLNPHSYNDKRMIHRSPPPPKILGQKAKSNHQGDSNEPPNIEITEKDYKTLNKIKRLQNIIDS